MNLDHIKKYEEELKNAGIDTGEVSPMLLPEYARHETLKMCYYSRKHMR